MNHEVAWRQAAAPPLPPSLTPFYLCSYHFDYYSYYFIYLIIAGPKRFPINLKGLYFLLI